ncbi:Glycoside hydrolase, family 19, catalytic [Dillenia turbinata]|uniref:Glycoside hydrolase, family 19, catalytic n=1 Tax=Dillenia turbinata TaxID=194707 RepID=A0AAN8USQ0_9MAGN
MRFIAVLVLVLLTTIVGTAAQEQCGRQAGGKVCPAGLCCIQYGYCGNTADYCTQNCQSQCDGSSPTPEARFLKISVIVTVGGLAQDRCGSQGGGNVCPGGLCCTKFGYCGSTSNYCYSGCGSLCPSISDGSGISSLISRSLFDQMLKYRNDKGCPGKGFYTYYAFLDAANSFPSFGTTGDTNTRRREIAAFLAQTSYLTSGGWGSVPDGPYAWGYCYLEAQNSTGSYCVNSSKWPCVAGKKYYGRGPIQIAYNYNYGPAGQALGVDLLSNPDLVVTDPTISFKTALWFWMTPQSPQPSCHYAITGSWTPSTADMAAGRLPGFGVTINLIAGGNACGNGTNVLAEDRIGFYKRYCNILGVGYGNNTDCSNQKPF